jgi:hypothetical protein
VVGPTGGRKEKKNSNHQFPLFDEYRSLVSLSLDENRIPGLLQNNKNID